MIGTCILENLFYNTFKENFNSERIKIKLQITYKPENVYTHEIKEPNNKVHTPEKIAQEESVAEEEKIAQEETVVEEEKIAQEETVVEEEKIAQEESVAEEEKIAQEESVAEEEKIEQKESVAEEEKIAQEESVAEEEKIEQKESVDILNELILLPKVLQLSNIIIGNKINYNNSYKYIQNKNIFFSSENLVNFKNLNNLTNKLQKNILNIFIFGNILVSDYENLEYSLKNLEFKFNLIINSSKVTFNDKFISICNLEKLQLIYAGNMNINNDKVVPLFKGINYEKIINTNYLFIKNILNKRIFEKEKLLFSSFNMKNGMVKSRRLANEFLKKNKISNYEVTKYEEYLDTLSKYKFCICPPSFSIDTYRLYECLCLKTIPICIKSIFTEYLKNIYPIMVLDNWEDLDLNNLDEFYKKANWDNYDNLKIPNILL